MAVFFYKAMDSGTPGSAGAVTGSIAADTPRLARELLLDRGLTVYELGEQTAASAGPSWLQRWHGGRQESKVLSFIRELSTLLAVGIPLLEALDTLIKQHRGHFRSTLLLLREKVASGLSLAQAMSELPSVFDTFCVNIVQVGENAGTLDTALNQLADFKERSQQFRGKIANALIYPAVVMTTAAGVSIFLMTFVVPKLLAGILEAGRPIPWPTRLVKGLSDLLVHEGWLLLLVAIGFGVALGAVLRSDNGRRRWHRFQLSLPVVGPMLCKQAVVRIAVIMSTLMRSGMTFMAALRIARQSTPNWVIAHALEDCEQAVTAGRDIGQALEAAAIFPPTVVQIFTVGQHAGQLEDMLDRLAGDYDRQLNTAAQRLTTLLEPLLILVMVMVVGLIAFATILPMLEATHVLH